MRQDSRQRLNATDLGKDREVSLGGVLARYDGVSLVDASKDCSLELERGRHLDVHHRLNDQPLKSLGKHCSRKRTIHQLLRGFESTQIPKKSKITFEVGGWVGPRVTSRGEKIFGKLSQNSPIPVPIFWGSISCVFFYILYVIKSC